MVTAKEGGGHQRVIGTAIGEGHDNYILMYNMLTGIRVAVSRCTAKPRRDELTERDFRGAHKLAFDITGNELTPSSKYDFKFKDYAPWVFRELRLLFGVPPADYLISLTSRYILSEMGSPGKSGSFFYFSQDYRFIIKTIHHAEHKFLRRILRYYYEHVQRNPNTLISRFFGLHRVKMPRGRKIHFVVMSNINPPHRDIHYTYDLKGSLVGRRIPQEQLDKAPQKVRKDLNWLDEERKLELGPQKRAELVGQLERDVGMLERLNIMDYSMLVGVHDVRRGNMEGVRGKTLSVFDPDPEGLALLGNAGEEGEDEEDLDEKYSHHHPYPSHQHHPSHGPSQHVLSPPPHSSCIFQRDDGGFLGTDEENQALDVLYYIGIIDILTPYTATKRFEHVWKALAHDASLISAVNPRAYARRFLNFMIHAIRVDENARPENPEGPPVTAPVDDHRPSRPSRTSRDGLDEKRAMASANVSAPVAPTVRKRRNGANRRSVILSSPVAR
ncbi:MAG: hypothetical protein DHS80DRAFT_15384 [Piptocephalis tieghemiana]|nr:MAG: hypothetical protein DHS80DRAFT_15384 [Piptocephalis tieghemiana]